MRRTRLIAVGTALALGSAITVGPASAADGVGTTTVSSSLLTVDVGADGGLLSIDLLNDTARATVDPKVATPEAFSRLTPLSVSSSALPAPLNSITVPAVESRSPGGAGEVTTAVVDLSNPTSGVAVPAALLSGVLSPATLTSAVDAAGSRSALTGSIGDLSAVGGLISAESAASTLGTTANAAKSEASRVLGTKSVSVLDFGALLDGIGLSVADLPVDAATAILDGLGVPVGDVAVGDLTEYLATLNGAIDELEVLIAGLSSTDVITGAVPTEIPPVLTDLGIPVPETDTTVASDVAAAINDVQAVVNDLLGQAVSALDALTLLEVDGVEVGTVASATGTLGDSVSSVTGKIGQITIGGIALPAVDLAAGAAQVNEATATVNGLLAAALGEVAPSLEDLVNVELFAKDGDNGTGTVDGYNRAVAGITAVAADITPPADLASVVSTIVGATGIAETIVAGGGTVPGTDVVMSTLETALGSVSGSVQALAGGAGIRVAQLRSVSNFVALGAPEGPRELPRTGSNNTTALALFGAVLAALALGVHRHVIAPARKG